MDETRLTNDATTSSKAKGNRSVIGKDGDCGEVIVNKGGGDGTGIGGTSADGLDLPGLCAVIRRARSGRTVRQMTTSVQVLELHTSAQGHKAYVHSIPVQNVGGSGEISHEFPPILAHKKNTSRFTGARRAIFGRSARARATDSGYETLHVPTTGSK